MKMIDLIREDISLLEVEPDPNKTGQIQIDPSQTPQDVHQQYLHNPELAKSIHNSPFVQGDPLAGTGDWSVDPGKLTPQQYNLIRQKALDKFRAKAATRPPPQPGGSSFWGNAAGEAGEVGPGGTQVNVLTPDQQRQQQVQKMGQLTTMPPKGTAAYQQMFPTLSQQGNNISTSDPEQMKKLAIKNPRPSSFLSTPNNSAQTNVGRKK